MPAPHAFYSKMLAERTASRNVFVLFYFIYPGVLRDEVEALFKRSEDVHTRGAIFSLVEPLNLNRL
jgi:hypothetical protein